ncbi:MAG: hypothetical protein NUK54_07255 [Methanothrix sp.]|nr:hypothetical protein [Methanothrix sp.]
MTSLFLNGIFGVGLFLLLLAGGAALHRLNIERTYRRVAATSKARVVDNGGANDNGGKISKDKLKEEIMKEMFTRQGSNFNAAAVAAWMLLFAAFAYFYFLTPEIFPRHNYFQVSALASGPLGFGAFGLLVLLFSLVAAAFAPGKVYGYYEISRGTKVAIMFAVPLLAVSIFLSVQQGTIYPETDLLSRSFAFLALFASEAALLWPVYADALGGMR